MRKEIQARAGQRSAMTKGRSQERGNIQSPESG